jgi:DNA-binding NtrC family response regulator
MQQQQQMIAHQRQQQIARQTMLAQQYSGVPVGMQSGMNQMTQAQFQAMRGNPMRPVNLPQHLQQAQQQAEHSLQQQQAAQQQVRNSLRSYTPIIGRSASTLRSG